MQPQICLLDLPTELLLQILYILSDVYPATSFDLGWITLGHVCSRLLGILSGERTLWARVVCLYPNAREEILARAADCPLDLIIDEDGVRPHPGLVKFVLRHLPRARKISFNCDDDTLELLQPSMILKSFPHLESALVAVGSYDYPTTFETDRTTESMFHSAKPYAPASKLQKLQMINTFIPYSPSTLTYLRMDFGCTDGVEVEPSNFLQYLRMCSQLRTLSLTRCIPRNMQIANASTNTTPSSLINLPHLRAMLIRDIRQRCSSLCSHLSVPIDTYFNITLLSANRPIVADELGLDVAIFKARLNGITSLGLHVDFSQGCLHVRFHDANSKLPYHVPGITPTLLEHATDIACIGELRYDYTSHVPLSRRFSMLRDLIESFICDKVEVLQLAYPGDISEGLNEISNLFPKLHTIFLDFVQQADTSSAEYAHIRDMLKPKHNPSDGQAIFRLPLLQTIWWQCYYSEPGKPPVLDLLLDIAKDRARSDRPLQVMRLVEHTADERWREDVLLPAVTRLCAVIPDTALLGAAQK